MPSAASVKPEKAPSAEASSVPPPAAGAADNSPIRQILVIIEHKIRNLEKRKSKLTSYRDLQKSGKELNADQKVAVAKYDEVAQTLEFARDMCKQVSSIALSAERDAKKQAKKDAWVRTAAETTKIRDTLLVLDCLVQMGSGPAREDFLQGANGATKLTEQDLQILDDLYPEVTPRHEPNEEGAPAFPALVMKAAEHLYSIVDGKPKEILGTTYAHIKQIVSSVHECGYFDKTEETAAPVAEEELAPEMAEPSDEEVPPPEEVQPVAPPLVYPPPPHALPSPAPLAPAPAPAAYPICPLPPITLQEVEHAYFTQQYAQQRPITEVIGSQNFFFLQESEIDSPAVTPQPAAQASPPGPIPTQTFTNQSYMTRGGTRVAPEPGVLPPQPHFPPAPPAELPAFPPAPLPPRALPHHPLERLMPQPVSHVLTHDTPSPRDDLAPAPPEPTSEPVAANDDEWSESPDREDNVDKPRPQGDGDAQNNRNRRYGRGARRGQSNGFRGARGGNRQSGDGYQGRRDDGHQGRQSNDGYQGRQNNDGYQGRNSDGYQGRNSDGYQGRNSDGYQGRTSDGYQGRQNNDGYQGRQNSGGYHGRARDDNYNGRNDSRNRNGDNGSHQNDNGGSRDKYENSQGGFQGGFKSRGRGGGPRGGFRGGPPRSSRPPPQFASKQNSSAE